MKIQLIVTLFTSLVPFSPLTALSGDSQRADSIFKRADEPTNHTLVSVEVKFVETNTKVRHKARVLSKTKADKLLASLKKQKTTSVSYPRVVTLDGKPVEVNSTVNLPFPARPINARVLKEAREDFILGNSVGCGTFINVTPTIQKNGTIHWKLRNHLLSRWSCKVGFAENV